MCIHSDDLEAEVRQDFRGEVDIGVEACAHIEDATTRPILEEIVEEPIFFAARRKPFRMAVYTSNDDAVAEVVA
jgi:hypothetical protein